MRKSHFRSKCAKISIFVENLRISRFWSKLATNLGFENLENLYFRRNFQKKSWFWSKFAQSLDFGRDWGKITILVEILKNLDYGRNFKKNTIFSKNLDFGWDDRKISIGIEIFENLDFGGNFSEISIIVELFEISWFWSKFKKISTSVESCKKNVFFFKFYWNFDFCRTFPEIAVFFWQFLKNRKLGRYFWKILILSRNFRSIYILVEICKKSRFGSNFSKISILVLMCENLDFGLNVRKSFGS